VPCRAGTHFYFYIFFPFLRGSRLCPNKSAKFKGIRRSVGSRYFGDCRPTSTQFTQGIRPSNLADFLQDANRAVPHYNLFMCCGYHRFFISSSLFWIWALDSFSTSAPPAPKPIKRDPPWDNHLPDKSGTVNNRGHRPGGEKNEEELRGPSPHSNMWSRSRLMCDLNAVCFVYEDRYTI